MLPPLITTEHATQVQSVPPRGAPPGAHLVSPLTLVLSLVAPAPPPSGCAACSPSPAALPPARTTPTP